jgi:hypothetical protein
MTGLDQTLDMGDSLPITCYKRPFFDIAWSPASKLQSFNCDCVSGSLAFGSQMVMERTATSHTSYRYTLVWRRTNPMR